MINKKELHKIINLDIAAIIEVDGNSDLVQTKLLEIDGHENIELGGFGVLTNAGFKDRDTSKKVPIIAVVDECNGKKILSWKFHKGIKDYSLVREWLEYHYPNANIFEKHQIKDLIKYCEGL